MKKTYLHLFFSAAVMASACSALADTSIFPIQQNATPSYCVAGKSYVVPSYKDADFCTEFHDAMICSCYDQEGKMGPVFCRNVASIIKSALGVYKTYMGACQHKYGKNADAAVLEECVTQWSCADTGLPPKGSAPGTLCSGNTTPGSACPNNNN